MSLPINIPPRAVVGKPITALWANQIREAIDRLARRRTQEPTAVVGQTSIKPPLLVTLQRVADDPTTYEVYAEFGHVVPRHNASTDTGEPIEITSLPTPDAPLAVIEDDKLWVELTIDVEGKCTAADFDSGTTWPEDAPPELIGGDDQSGTEGQRYIRIAEIIADPESTATPPPLIREQLHTGHIDYAQPTLSENTTTSPSTGEARVMKEWNASAGRWDLRYLEGEDGVEIEEDGDRIVIRATGGHPWKVANAGSGNATVAAGKIQGVITALSPLPSGTDLEVASTYYPFKTIFVSYAGGLVAVTGAGWLYAKVALLEGLTAQSGLHVESTYHGISESYPTGAVTLYFSSDAPSALAPSVADEIHLTIAQVTVAAGVVTVTDQVLTHNPIIQLTSFGVDSYT